MNIAPRVEAERASLAFKHPNREMEYVVSAHAVTDDNRLMLITDGGQMICIGASDLRVIGRNTRTLPCRVRTPTLQLEGRR